LLDVELLETRCRRFLDHADERWHNLSLE